MQVQPRDNAIGGLAIIAAAVVVIARMQRHVDVADEVDEEGERLEPDIVGQALVGKYTLVSLDLRADATQARAVLAHVVFFGHRLGLVVPGKGMSPAPVLAAQAIGPHAGVLQAVQFAIGRAQQGRGLEQPVDLRTRIGAHVLKRDIGSHRMRVEAPGLRLYGQQQRGQRRTCAQAMVSYCSMTHSSLSDASIQVCSHSCSHTACI